MQASFDDHIVLVTGASTGIGAAIARGFADAGATVAVHYNRSRTEAQEVFDSLSGPGKHSLVQGDLTETSEVDNVVRGVMEDHGHVDVLVNNAGGLLGRRALEDVDDDYYQRTMDLNVRHVVQLTRAVVPGMRERGRGSIINVTSVAARNGGGGGSVIYASSKGTLLTMTRGFARELADSGIRVNGLSPGTIQTRFHERNTSDEQLRNVVGTIPMGRLGQPEDCVGPALFLASDEMAGYVTGQVLEVNGGQLMA